MDHKRAGLTFIEVLIDTVIIAAIASGSLAVYLSIVNTLSNSTLRSEAVSLLNREIEIAKNLPYDQVGVQNGAPAGVLTAEKTVSSTNNYLFTIKTTIRNIDDPFDGTLGGNPNDTAPADYKLAQFEINCVGCSHFAPLALATIIAPKNLESATKDGSLFINVFNALGADVPGALVHVTNTSTTPTINLTDTTNENGILQLVGVPTSTQNYRIEVSQIGYSSDQTYRIDDPANPNPVKPDATVAEETLTQLSFAIDKTSNVKVKTVNQFCTPIANQNFSLIGTKLIGTSPDILKYSTSSVTDGQGVKNMNNLEWDTYSLTYSGANDILGTMPLSPFTINPSSSIDLSFVLVTSTPNSLLVTARSAVNNSGIANTTLTLSKTGFSQTLITGHNFVKQTDWSGGQYSSSNGVDTTSTPGSVKLALGPIGYAPPNYFFPTAYALGEGEGNYVSSGWLVSQTFDLGSASATFYTISWNPTSQPPLTGADSLKFQIASNNDQSTWNFVGPDGTASTFYTVNGGNISGVHNNNRYFRYKALLNTLITTFTPSLDDITIEFNGACVPLAQSLFNNLSIGNYTLQASAIGFQLASTTVDINSPWQQTDIILSP